LSSDRGYQKLSSDRGFQQLSSDRGYRQLSSDRGSAISSGYEYDNGATSLYAYDNPSVNNDIGGPSSFSRSQYHCGSGNPTFALEPTETLSSLYYQQQQQQQTLTSLSLPYLRRAGDYSNYFSVQDEDDCHHHCLMEIPNRPTTLEVQKNY